MYRVCRLRLGLNIRVWQTADKNCDLRLGSFRKYAGLGILQKKHLRPCSCINFTTTVIGKNSKTEI